MDNEKKTYSIIGKVEIGTDEYRDLIEKCAETEAELSRARGDYWRITSEVDQLKKSIEELEKMIATFKKFINSDDAVNTKYINFLAENSFWG